MVMIIEERDILSANHDLIFIPVNMRGVMGKGLAKQFRAQYPKLFNTYLDMCKDKRIRSKICTAPDIRTGREFLFFPTKDHWWDNSDLLKIIRKLDMILDALEESEYNSIAMPLLGAGNGNLREDDVEATLIGMLEPFEKVSGIQTFIYKGYARGT